MTIQLGISWDGRLENPARQLIDATAGAGFDSVGLAGHLIDCDIDCRTDSDVASALARAGIACHEVMALTISNNDQATLAAAGRIAKKAALIRAPWVVTVFTADMDRRGIARAKECAGILEREGTRMAVEFSPIGSVTSIPEALELVDTLGPDRSGLLIDSWHFFNGESTWDDLVRVPLEKIAYLQFSDALSPASEDQMDETMNRRTMPGKGAFDLERFAATLLQREWVGLVSVEVLSGELSIVPPAEFARVAYESASRYWL